MSSSSSSATWGLGWPLLVLSVEGSTRVASLSSSSSSEEELINDAFFSFFVALFLLLPPDRGELGLDRLGVCELLGVGVALGLDLRLV